MTSSPNKKKKILLIVIIAAVVVVLGGAGAVFLLMGGEPEAGQQAEEEHAEEEQHFVYEKLETFTVNLADQESYLQTEISLKVADPAVQEKLKLRMPEVRDALLRLLSSKTAEELATPDGKDELSREVRKEINALIGAKKADQGVQGVLFTSFIIQ